MFDRLMSAGDLERVTGKKLHSKQSEWFKDRFGFMPITSGDGTLIVTWATFEALEKRHAGLPLAESIPTQRRSITPPLRAVK